MSTVHEVQLKVAEQKLTNALNRHEDGNQIFPRLEAEKGRSPVVHIRLDRREEYHVEAHGHDA